MNIKTTDTELTEYTGNDSVFSVPCGITKIADRAFFKNGSIREIELGKDVEEIGWEAFMNCESLEKVTFGENVKRVSAKAFSGCRKLKEITVRSSSVFFDSSCFDGCRHLDTLILGDGVKTLRQNFLNSRVVLEKIVLPEDIIDIQFNKISYTPQVNLPENYLKQTHDLDMQMTPVLMRRAWGYSASLEDYCYLYLFQANPYMREMIESVVYMHINRCLKLFIEILKKSDEGLYGKKTYIFNNLADLVSVHKDEINDGNIRAFYDYVKENNIENENIKHFIEEYEIDVTNLSHVEKYCRHNFSEWVLDKTMKKLGIKNEELEGVVYTDGKPVSPFVIKCILVPYLNLLKETMEKNNSDEENYSVLEYKLSSDRIVKYIDISSLRYRFETIANEHDFIEHPEFIMPYARFANDYQIAKIKERLYAWDNPVENRTRENVPLKVAKGGLFLNNTPEAVEFAERMCLFDLKYDIRGMFDEVLDDKEKIREAYLKHIESDFLTSRKTPVRDFREIYMRYPVSDIIKGVVWRFVNLNTLEDFFFTVTDSNRIVGSDGEEIELPSEGKVSVAHPMEMSWDEIGQFVGYFMDEGITQPLKQLEENVYELDSQELKDRYRGIKVSYEGIEWLKQHGYPIAIHNNYYHGDEYFRLDDYSRINIVRDSLSGKAVMTDFVLNFRSNRKEINRALNVFDELCLELFVAKDSIDRVMSLEYLITKDNIMHLIDVANESGSTECLMWLLNFKDEQAEPIDVFDEFTI